MRTETDALERETMLWNTWNLNIPLYHLKTNDMNAIALRRSNWDTRALFGDPRDPEEKAKVGLSSRVYKNKIVVNTLKCLEQNQPGFLQKMYQKR